MREWATSLPWHVDFPVPDGGFGQRLNAINEWLEAKLGWKTPVSVPATTQAGNGRRVPCHRVCLATEAEALALAAAFPDLLPTAGRHEE